MPCQCTNLSFKTLASGSKGNSAYVIAGDVKLLIDAGITYKSIKERLAEDKLLIDDFSLILITHNHMDHIKGLRVLLKRTNLKVLIPKYMYDELSTVVPKDRVIFIKNKNKLGNIEIDVFKTSHDAISVGYIISVGCESLVYITDTGYLSSKILKLISNKSIYLIESNYDEEMLITGRYPPHLKQRVLSDKGHLSNSMTAEYLKNVVGDKTKYVILAHISENNNTPELAFNETKKILENKNIKLMVAGQYEAGEVVDV